MRPSSSPSFRHNQHTHTFPRGTYAYISASRDKKKGNEVSGSRQENLEGRLDFGLSSFQNPQRGTSSFSRTHEQEDPEAQEHPAGWEREPERVSDGWCDEVEVEEEEGS